MTEHLQCPAPRNTIVRRSLISVATLVTLFHLFATFLWVAPASNLRLLFPGDTLTQYMIPMWGQSWSVFAPEPINGDYYFDVRAVVADEDGDETTTDWMRATDVELSRATYHLFPPRSAGLGIDVASTLKAEWDALSQEQSILVGEDYFAGKDPIQQMSADLAEIPSEDSNVEEYLTAERVATGYATQIARAVWGDDVVRVQYQASRKNVIPYADRNNPNAERPPIQPVHTGWRALEVRDRQSDALFADYFCSAPLEVCADDR